MILTDHTITAEINNGNIVIEPLEMLALKVIGH
jgi:hypothetical protein